MLIKVTLSPLVLSKITLADARVACPHKGISITGEKNRIEYSFLLLSSTTNAVSERPNSLAIDSISDSDSSSLSKQTPAGLPLKGSSVNESTI